MLIIFVHPFRMLLAKANIFIMKQSNVNSLNDYQDLYYHTKLILYRSELIIRNRFISKKMGVIKFIPSSKLFPTGIDIRMLCASSVVLRPSRQGISTCRFDGIYRIGQKFCNQSIPNKHYSSGHLQCSPIRPL